MGADLEVSGSLRFWVGIPDPNGAPLDRIQVIKVGRGRQAVPARSGCRLLKRSIAKC